MFPKLGLRLVNKPQNTHRTRSYTIVAPFWWKKHISGHISVFEIYFLQTEPYHSLQHVLVLYPTVHSSGLTVDPKHAVGLWSCSLREEHPTVSALKSTATSAYHHNPTKCKALSWNVSELHQLKILGKRVHSDIQILAREIYWNIAEDTLCYKSFSPCKVSKWQEATLKKAKHISHWRMQ